jgi:cytochrome c oxidase cbb3-type subunit III
MSNTDQNKFPHGEPEIDELTHDRYLGGHEYDGIRELDNKLPRWWVYLFILTVIFAAVYLFGYHIGKWWPLQEDEYSSEMAVVAKNKPVQPEMDMATLVPFTDAQNLAAGEGTFKKICFVCHGMQGQGLVGPNFTDAYWIHGDTITKTVGIKDLYKVVITGVLDKGMISYKDQLSPLQIQQVLSYIISLQGTNPPNPKAPQGVKYEKFG